MDNGLKGLKASCKAAGGGCERVYVHGSAVYALGSLSNSVSLSRTVTQTPTRNTNSRAELTCDTAPPSSRSSALQILDLGRWSMCAPHTRASLAV